MTIAILLEKMVDDGSEKLEQAQREAQRLRDQEMEEERTEGGNGFWKCLEGFFL